MVCFACLKSNGNPKMATEIGAAQKRAAWYDALKKNTHFLQFIALIKM
jgi:hypothetical protein